jgi:c-di-GMP-binding flagellar brake protein YcgR
MAWTPRQHPRFKAALPIELRPKGAPAPLRTQTADIGLGGCYVEIVFTQEVSTPVELTMWLGDFKIVASGEIVSKHPSFGNGIKFTAVNKEGREKLGEYLESLKPHGLMMNESPIAGVSSNRR